MRVSDEHRLILEKIVGIHHIAVSPPFFVPSSVKSFVNRAIKLNNKKTTTNDIQRVCTPR